MAKFRVRLTEMRDADVRFISLVDKAASRLPIRILKRENSDMGIDLNSYFKRGKAAKSEVTPKPTPETPTLATVTAFVVAKQATEEQDAAMKKAVADAGFDTSRIFVSKNEDGSVDPTLIYAQQEENPFDGDVVLVRLSDQSLIAVKGFNPANPGMDDATFKDTASTKNLYQNLDSSMDTLFSKVCSILQKSSDEKEAAKTVSDLIDGFKDHAVSLVKGLPPAAFKADLALQSIAEAEEAKKNEGESPVTALLATAPEGYNWEGLSDEQRIADLLGKASKKEGHTHSKPDAMDDEEWGKMSDEDKAKKCKDCNNPDDSKKDDDDSAKKFEEVLTALKGVTAQVQALEANITGIVAKSDEDRKAVQKTVDDLVQKQDDISKKLASTVVAPTTPEDAPSGSVVKSEGSDDDPRTGGFDTALIARRLKYDKK